MCMAHSSIILYPVIEKLKNFQKKIGLENIFCVELHCKSYFHHYFSVPLLWQKPIRLLKLNSWPSDYNNTSKYIN